MGKKQKVKPMFSLKRRFGEDTDDPIISAWRTIKRNHREVHVCDRLFLLAMALPPFKGTVMSDTEKMPEEFLERIRELDDYLYDAKELDEAELFEEAEEHRRNFVAQFLDEMRTDINDEGVSLLQNEATLKARAGEVTHRAWTIACRVEDKFWERVDLARHLVLLSCVGKAVADIDNTTYCELARRMNGAVCQFLEDHQNELLTPDQIQELASYTGHEPQPSA